jgi:hypothetical protein
LAQVGVRDALRQDGVGKQWKGQRGNKCRANGRTQHVEDVTASRLQFFYRTGGGSLPFPSETLSGLTP